MILASSNSAVPQTFRTRQERDARRAALGLVVHEGGRSQPVERSVSVRQPTPAPVEESVYDTLPCDVEP